VTNNREHDRHEWDGVVRAKCATWNEFLDLYTANISHGGLFVRHGSPPEEGGEVTIELEMPNHERLTLHGRVAHVASGGGDDDPATGFGVEFVGVTPEQIKHLADLVGVAKQHQSAPPPPLPK
jgi:uncharacterized protein (TIGR02266 family)